MQRGGGGTTENSKTEKSRKLDYNNREKKKGKNKWNKCTTWGNLKKRKDSRNSITEGDRGKKQLKNQNMPTKSIPQQKQQRPA